MSDAALSGQTDGRMKRSAGRSILSRLAPVGRGLLYLALIVLFSTPFLWMIFGSLRPQAEIFRYVYPLQWHTFVPVEWTLQNFKEVLGLSEAARQIGLNFGPPLRNSFLVSSAVVLSSLLFNTMGAYFFARLRFPGKELLFIFVIATMLVPLQVTIVPLYIVVRGLNLDNSLWALIVPWYTSPFIIFSLRQFFAEIPKELDEAAVIGGASRWRILWQVIVPNSIPGLVTNALLEFQFIWNLFYWPLIAAPRKELQVIQVAIAGQQSRNAIFWGRIFAGCALASVPVVLLFLIMQRYYVRGVVTSGLKG
jgi:ABC-type glycerol-3-phosphate transport system permease component